MSVEDGYPDGHDIFFWYTDNRLMNEPKFFFLHGRVPKL